MRPILTLLLLVLLTAPLHAATIEFLSGNKVECKVLKKDNTTMTVEITTDGKKETRTFKLSTVHKVTINDKTHIINEKPDKGSAKPKSNGQDEPADATIRRSKTEVEALINQQGREPPEWFEATPLVYPPSLDLAWPEPPKGAPWDNQKNVGQYIWDVINPNPGKWREAIRLMHHLLQMHKDDVEQRKKIMGTLGSMYHNLHQDYARAAFWWRQAGIDKSTKYGPRALLAECYVRLGNKQMALDLVGKDPITAMKIKLYADLGDLKQAGQWAEKFNETNGGDFAYLAVADGYRSQGKNKEALAWYEKAVALCAKPTFKGRCKNRAESSLEAIKLAELADVSRVADGTFAGEALGYEGPIHVSVSVKAKRIEDVKITQHKEKQFYSSLTDTPAQIIAKQGVKGVDTTSHATITSVAIINASAKALASGAK
jgi:uncharacterized protein with FMN-binding domain